MSLELAVLLLTGLALAAVALLQGDVRQHKLPSKDDPPRPLPARARARVLDTSLVDVSVHTDPTDRDDDGWRGTQTWTRVLVVFRGPDGQDVVAETTCPLTPAQKDILLPDAEIEIAYDPADPPRIELVLPS